MRLPFNDRLVNPSLSELAGEEIYYVDFIEVQAGDAVRIKYERSNSEFFQAVNVLTDGQLLSNDHTSPMFVMWYHTSPPVIHIDVLSTASGRLYFYSQWGEVNPHNPEELWSYSLVGPYTGMRLLENDEESGRRTYGCNDVAPEPTWESLVFSIERNGR